MIDNTFHAALIVLFVCLIGATGVPPAVATVPDTQVTVHREVAKVQEPAREI
jgi:hypothetical protein